MAGRERAVSRPAVRRLLGALLLTPGPLVDRARVVTFVWGPAGCDPAALHSAVYRLLFGISKSAAERILNHLAPLLAISLARRSCEGNVYIVDGRYSTNLQVVIDAHSRLVVAIGDCSSRTAKDEANSI